jgi:hypothetical protein
MSRCKLLAAAVLGGWLGTTGLYAQNTTPGPAPAAKQTPATKPDSTPTNPSADQDAPPSGNGKVLFSRSIDDNNATGNADASPTAKPVATPPASSTTAGLEATPEERSSLTFLAYDLDVRLVPRQESLAVRASFTVRNDGDKPLKRLALQLSSTLKWEQIRTEGANIAFAQHFVDSDTDHTGAVNEAIVTLPRELAPKQELKLETLYSGLASLNAERLERIGAPTLSGERSDWDQVSPDFIGLRGFGNVVWYPVSAPVAMLGDGAKLFAEIGRQKLRQQQARVAITVTSEFTADALAPNLAVLDGQVVAVVQTAAPQNAYPGVVTATLPATVLGFSNPSLFLLRREKVEGNGVRIHPAYDDLDSTPSITTAANLVTPLIQQWLGAKPGAPVTVVGLPEANDIPAEEGTVFFTGFKATPDPKDIESAVVHSVARAYFRSPRVWLAEGVPQFLGSLWVEQIQGRETALEAMNSARGALALAEPNNPGDAVGQSLIQAYDPVYYRTKANYVLWMLRDLAGDDHLATALQAYSPQQDTTPDYFEKLVEKSSGKDLKWFFDAWVYQDLGLPDLSITGVFPSKSLGANQAGDGQWLVAFDVANDGYAEAEVPVTLTSTTTSITERLRIPARGKLSHRILIGGLPTEVRVNDGTVPELQDSIHIRKLTPEAP